MNKPCMVRIGLLDMQTCVPHDYTDKQIIEFVESQHPCGTTQGWHIDYDLGRVQCAKDENCVHVVVVA